MIVLLSPAKKLHESSVVAQITPTISPLMDQTELLMETTRRLSINDIKRLMSLSDKLAMLNHERFQSFKLPFDAQNATPAIGTFAGDTYIGFDAATLSADDLAFAQEHVGILSGLYGLLRPLDLMQPYRLEMKTRLPTERGKSLYDFWGDRVAKTIEQRLGAHPNPMVINLASAEYFRVVRAKTLAATVITPTFKEVKPDGSMKTVSFVAKRARGMMARYLVDHRLTEAAGLKAFDRVHYQFSAALSTETNWVFTRPWQATPLAGMPY